MNVAAFPMQRFPRFYCSPFWAAASPLTIATIERETSVSCGRTWQEKFSRCCQMKPWQDYVHLEAFHLRQASDVSPRDDCIGPTEWRTSLSCKSPQWRRWGDGQLSTEKQSIIERRDETSVDELSPGEHRRRPLGKPKRRYRPSLSNATTSRRPSDVLVAIAPPEVTHFGVTINRRWPLVRLI